MKIYFDTEFTGLRRDTSLISIGCISEEGDTFYAELDDFNKNDVDAWMIENVFGNTFRVDPKGYFSKANPMLEYINGHTTLKSTICYGGRGKVSFAIKHWLKIIGGESAGIEFISDVCHYDMVLLIDLITDGNTALNLPDWVCASCHDINQDIAWLYQITEKEAFDKNREEIVKDIYQSYTLNEYMKHNALYDAEVIRVIHKEIENRRTQNEF